MTDFEIVRAGISSVDDCPVLTRMSAFIVDQGIEATLEHTFRAKGTGNPVDLSSVFGPDGSSLSTSDDKGTVVLRVKEALGRGCSSSDNPIWDVPGEAHTPSLGIVRAKLPKAAVQKSGIYQLSWGIKNQAGGVILINNALLSVERSLFSDDLNTVANDTGPLTIQRIRAKLRDSHPNENMRLDNVEFGDEEIINAILTPVEYFNEHPPPIGKWTTRSFGQWQHNWSEATIAQLYLTAASWYRRNKQQLQAGGVMDDDLNRDQAYEAKGQQLWKAFTEWVINKKYELNVRLVTGSIGSVYGRRSY